MSGFGLRINFNLVHYKLKT